MRAGERSCEAQAEKCGDYGEKNGWVGESNRTYQQREDIKEYYLLGKASGGIAEMDFSHSTRIAHRQQRIKEQFLFIYFQQRGQKSAKGLLRIGLWCF